MSEVITRRATVIRWKESVSIKNSVSSDTHPWAYFSSQARWRYSSDTPMWLFTADVLRDFEILLQTADAIVLFQEEMPAEYLEHLGRTLREKYPATPLLVIARRHPEPGSFYWVQEQVSCLKVPFMTEASEIEVHLNTLFR